MKKMLTLCDVDKKSIIEIEIGTNFGCNYKPKRDWKQAKVIESE